MENPNAGLHGIIQAYCNRFPSIIRTLSTPRAWGQAPRGHESAIRVLFIETSTIVGLVQDILLVATFPPQLSRSNGSNVGPGHGSGPLAQPAAEEDSGGGGASGGGGGQTASSWMHRSAHPVPPAGDKVYDSLRTVHHSLSLPPSLSLSLSLSPVSGERERERCHGAL
jgi:hypothetical protein